MVINFLRRLGLGRNFWRQASFDEVGILYISRFLRLLAMNLSSIFILIFLYELGYSFGFLAIYLAGFYFFKVIGAILGGFYIARFGPKHGALLSNLLYIPTLIIISHTAELGLGAVVIGMILQALSVAIYNLSYDINFSKIKSLKRAGRQLGVANMMEKIIGGLAPMVGGFLAIWLGPQTVMIISAGIFALAAIPLLATEEPIRTNQKISIIGFPWHNFWHNLVGQIGVGFDAVSSQIWSILVPIFIFVGQNSYGVIGVLSSVAAVIGALAALIYGRFVDRGQGLKLLQIPVALKSITLAIRGAFINTPITSVASNLVSEATTTGYHMAYYKGAFDAADRSGSRIVYMMALAVCGNLAATLASGLLFGLLQVFHSEEIGLRFFLVISAIGLMALSLADFPLYREKSRQYRED